MQLRGLMWGKDDEAQTFVFSDLLEVTGLMRSTLYGHMAVLRHWGWLLFSSSQYGRITIYLHGCAQAVDKTVDNSVDKPVDNLSRNLDSSFNGLDGNSLKPKELNHTIPDLSSFDTPREEAVQKTGQPVQKIRQPVQKTGQLSRNPDSLNGWHDVLLPDLRKKLDAIGVETFVYPQLAEAARAGGWTQEQLRSLADQIRGEDCKSKGGLYVHRVKKNLKPVSEADRQQSQLEEYRRLARDQRAQHEETA